MSSTMNDYEDIEGMVAYIISPITIIIAFFLGAKLSDLYPWFFRWLVKKQRNSQGLEKDIVEIKKTTIQLAKEWIELTKMVQKNKDERTCFVTQLKSYMETNIKTLGKNISISLEEESLRNDQRFVKMKRTIETMQEEILYIKHFLETFAQKFYLISTQKSLEENDNKQMTFTDNFAQTDNEIKRRITNTHSKTQNTTEQDASKLITMVKKSLTDFMADTKLHLSIDREEENRELQIILSKLAEDREDIKKTIVQAFSIAADQAKKNYDQFSHIGQDAMHYIAVLNENTNKMLKLKLEETDNRLKEILNAVNRQIFDFGAVRETLENIDGQFDEIFQRVELGCQRNTEHCEEMAESLEKTANSWVTAVSELQNVAKGLSNNTQKMREMLKEMAYIKQTDKQENNKEQNEIVHYDSITNETTQDLRILSEKQRNMIFIYSMIQSCWENMTCMNNRVENGCEAICKLIDTLENKLVSLNESVVRLDDIIRNADLENLRDHLANSQCSDANEKNKTNMEKSNIGNAGDGYYEVFQNITSKLATEAQNIHNVIAVDKEVKMIELILRKVCDKRDVKFKKREILYQCTEDVSEECSTFEICKE